MMCIGSKSEGGYRSKCSKCRITPPCFRCVSWSGHSLVWAPMNSRIDMPKRLLSHILSRIGNCVVGFLLIESSCFESFCSGVAHHARFLRVVPDRDC